MKRFRSKIGLVFVVPVTLAMAVIAISMASKSWFSALLFIMILGGFMVYLMRTTFYDIDKEKLIITCGFFKNKIDISSIRKITASRDLISSPALSIDRLEILYNKFDTVLVSPKDKDGFINHLKEINRDIEVKLK